MCLINSRLLTIVSIPLLLFVNPLLAAEDFRQLVERPERMQEHMLSNMRDHLAAIN